MKRTVTGISLMLVSGALLSLPILGTIHLRANADGRDDDSRVREGLRIAPVRLDLRGKNRAEVGLGSYLVNAVAGCNDCHTCPSYTPGHDPYGPPFGPPGGGDGQVNKTNYLAGGVPFIPPGVVSPNLTPDPTTGRPDGNHTFRQFLKMMRTGHDADEAGRILQVMPWPVFRNMSDEDLHAIYQYLSAIPHAEPGTCVAPGQ